MSLTVCLKKVTNLPGRHERQAGLSFRGFTHKTKKMKTGTEADFCELFRWPHYGKQIVEEVLTVRVYNCSKVFSNRLLGTLTISLQHLTKSGRLILTEALVDKNHSVTGIYVELDIRYQPPDGAAGTWVGDDFFSPVEDSSAFIIRNVAFEDEVIDMEAARKLDKDAVTMGKKLVKGTEDDDDDDDDDSYDESEIEITGINFTPVLSRCSVPLRDKASSPKPRNFQIAVTVIQAQKLVGVNIDPVVHVKVGDEKRHTATQKSTNCPYYNQYFLFEFLEPREVVFNKLIEISVFHAKKISFLGTRLGTFKIDAGTVYNQPDHRFLQKWAVMTDPKDTRAGIKGYVKCNLSIVSRGDHMNAPPSSTSGQNDDIEKNLLLPKRVPAERPWAKICVRIYRAEGLPSMSAGIMGSFSKLMGEKKVFIDPYVQVSFAGQQGETSVESDTTGPEWNEQISFIEMFPPLARKMKVQVLDDAHIGDVALGTHFIDLQQISDPSRNAGFNPTFGPAWVNLYGSPQNYTLRDVHRDLNEGLGEGIFYRGRILMAVSVEIFSSNSTPDKKPLQALKNAFSKLKMKKKSKKSKEKAKESAVEQSKEDEAEDAETMEQPSAVTVEVEEIHPLPETALGVKEEFLLFGVFFEVTMIDPSIGTKPVKFETSIGNYGKIAEVVPKSSKKSEKMDAGSEERQGLLDTGSEDELDMADLPSSGEQPVKSVTPSKRPELIEDGSYSCISLVHNKPCVYVWSYWEDHSWRLCNSNWIIKIAERLERGIEDVEKLMRRPKSNPEVRLKQVLVEFVAGCRQYSLNAGKRTMSRPNNLDQCRMKSLTHNIVLYAKQGMRASRRLTKKNIDEKIDDGKRILLKLRFLAKEPQCTLPDVLIWMFSNNKRVAYARIPAQDILYSVVEEEKGKDCGKIHTVFFKTPGSYNGEIFAKAEIYLWLGVTKYIKNSTAELPGDFKLLYEKAGQLVETPTTSPPSQLSRDDFSYFQLRAHLYQARGVLPADDNGLSDPFARVVFGNQCQTTKVINETLAPMWNELLLFDHLLMDGNREDLKNDPPIIIINLFDQDKFGPPDYLGRAFATPIVTLLEDDDDDENEDGDKRGKYTQPSLQFFDIFKGNRAGGELIATFELIQLDHKKYLEPSVPESVLPREPEFMDEQSEHYIIPQGIRPVLKEFRIEVLFWGLRDLRRINLFEVDQPQVRIECAGQKVESEVILSYKEFPNFTELVKSFNVDLPEQAYLHPPLSIFVVEKRAFGRTVMVGSTVVSNLMTFAPKELEDNDENSHTKPRKSIGRMNSNQAVIHIETEDKGTDRKFNPLNLVKDPLKKLHLHKIIKEEDLEEEKPDLEEMDWWSKYYESLREINDQMQLAEEDEDAENEEGGDAGHLNVASIDAEGDEDISYEVEPVKTKRKPIATLEIYNSMLGKEFDKFEDWLHIFPLQCGKALDEDDADEGENFMGNYKGSFYIYPAEEATPEFQIMRGVPRNRPVKVLVRVYIIKATNLSPADPNGKADPYVVVKVGEQEKNSKDRYIPKQLNPVFGEVFELTISFPVESEILISVFDHDLVGSDDLIGETKLDLENRFYSNHRANCGIASQYDTDGYNKWRDAFKPSQILSSLCKKHSLPAPEYRKEEVKVNNKIFKIPSEAFPEEAFIKDKNKEGEDESLSAYDEHKALYVLQHWDEMPEYGTRLVPEHVEVRTLHNPDSPGLGQGSLHMWIDMFPNDVPAPPPVNIKPREPISYELRVTIWNTDDVILDDVNPITGEPSSDIYVKAWLRGLDSDKQETDVHFNSLTGEGNFNWRFVFRFDYLPTEKEITYKKKDSIFSLEESEFREPAVLALQVWDYDRITANDFLGSIELKLCDMVRGAKTAHQCTIKLAKDKATPRFSIFRNKRMKGWWPFIKLKSEEDEEREEREADMKTKKKKKKKSVNPEDVQYTDTSGNTHILAGKVEAEFQLLTVEEAEKSPVGLGRKEPEPLEKPNRPKTSFNWFVNPLKTFVFFIWKKYKKYIIALVIIAILTVFLVLILYTMPGYISQKIING